MKAQLEVTLKPFIVPNFVILEQPPRSREEGFKEADKVPLSSLDPITLEKLCSDFTNEIFKKAGKTRPPRCK